MQLLESRLLALEASAAHLELVLPVTHPCFAGHFPGRPILPGVVQIDWAIRIAELHLGPCAPFVGCGPVKFMRLIEPAVTLQLWLERDAERGQLRFEYSVQAAVCSSGRVLFGTPPR